MLYNPARQVGIEVIRAKQSRFRSRGTTRDARHVERAAGLGGLSSGGSINLHIINTSFDAERKLPEERFRRGLPDSNMEEGCLLVSEASIITDRQNSRAWQRKLQIISRISIGNLGKLEKGATTSRAFFCHTANIFALSSAIRSINCDLRWMPLKHQPRRLSQHGILGRFDV